MPVDSRVKKLLELFAQAKSARANFETHWQDVADLVVPTREFTVDHTPGAQLRGRIYDDTAPNAAMRLSAAIDGLMTNDAMRWFHLSFADNPDGEEDRDAQIWLRMATQRLYDVFNHPDSGWGEAKFEMYQDEVAFGSAAMTAVRSRRSPSPVRFQARPLGEVYTTRDDEGMVLAVFRRFRMKARDVVRRWPRRSDDRNVNGASDGVVRCAEDPKKSGDEVRILHVVMRRDDRDPLKIDVATNKPWGSYYLELDESHLLAEGGFDDNPFITPRWTKASGEEYGRGPGMSSLPSIRVVNAMQRTQLIAGEMSVAPPLSVPANGVEGPIRLAPHSIIYRRAGTGGDFIAPINTGARPDIGESQITARQTMIANNFFLDMLSLPTAGDAGSEGHPRMSATEAMIRVRQKQQTMAPFLSRLKSEFLGPVIRTVFGHMARAGMLPDPPPSVAGRRLEVQYVSPLATSQRASEVTDVLQMMESITPLLNVSPDSAQAIDADAAVRHIASLLNISPKILKTPEQVAQARQQIDQLQAASQQAEIARNTGSAIKDTAAGISQIQEGQVA